MTQKFLFNNWIFWLRKTYLKQITVGRVIPHVVVDNVLDCNIV